MTTFRILKDEHGNVFPMTNDQLFQHYVDLLLKERERIKREDGTVNDFINMYSNIFNTDEKKIISGFLRGRLHFTGTIESVLTSFFNMRVLG